MTDLDFPHINPPLQTKSLWTIPQVSLRKPHPCKQSKAVNEWAEAIDLCTTQSSEKMGRACFRAIVRRRPSPPGLKCCAKALISRFHQVYYKNWKHSENIDYFSCSSDTQSFRKRTKQKLDEFLYPDVDQHEIYLQ